MKISAKGTIRWAETPRWICNIPQRIVKSGYFTFVDKEPVKVTLDTENDRIIIEHFKPGEQECL